MKTYKEITLDNLGELKSIISEVKAEANDKKDYIQKIVILVGEETIRKAIEKYHVGCLEREWRCTDKWVQYLKINGTAEFIYVAYVRICWNAFKNRGNVDVYCIEKVVSYKGYILSACADRYNGKTYNLYLFNEKNDNKQGVTVEKPNKVGTLTDKKADAWLSALLDEAEKRQEARKAADGRKSAFMERMAKLTKHPASTFENDGTLYLGMFMVKWSYRPDGQAYTQIEIVPCSKRALERLSILADCGLLG